MSTIEFYFFLLLMSVFALFFSMTTSGRGAKTSFHAFLIGIEELSLMWAVFLFAYFVQEEKFSWYAVGMAALSIIGAAIVTGIIALLFNLSLNKEPLE